MFILTKSRSISLNSYSEVHELLSDIASRVQVFEAKRQAVVVRAYEHSTMTEVDQLPKSAIHITKTSSLLPGSLRALVVTQNKAPQASYRVEWVMEKRSDRDEEELTQSDTVSDLTEDEMGNHCINAQRMYVQWVYLRANPDY